MKRARSTPLYGGILVGGQSRRMGYPKHLLELDAISFMQRISIGLEGFVDDLFILGSGDVPSANRYIQLQDAAGVDGPLSGIVAALQHDANASWLVVACDMPLLTKEAVAWLLEKRQRDKIAVLPRLDAHGVEPLFAVYESTVLPFMLANINAGHHGPQRLAQSAQVSTPLVPKSLRRAWTNVNDVAEFEALSRP